MGVRNLLRTRPQQDIYIMELYKCFALVAIIPLILGAPSPDYGVQEGDDGSHHHGPHADHGSHGSHHGEHHENHGDMGHDHHSHAHEDHDHNHEGHEDHHEEEHPKPPKKHCELVAETKEGSQAYAPGNCFNEPECKDIC